MVQTCLNKYFETHGMIHEITSPYALEKRTCRKKKQNCKENDECNAKQFGLPSNMLGKGISSTFYGLNRIPHKKIGKHLLNYENLCEIVNYFKTWGCLAKVPLSKLEKRNQVLKLLVTF